MNRYFLLNLIVILILSCEKETKIDIPSSQPQVAVSSILIPNKPIEIYVYKSMHVTDTKDLPIINATVNLFVNGLLLTKLPHDSAGIYRNNIEPKIGNTYYLEVLTDDFDKVTAQTTVPNPVVIDSINIDRYVGSSGNGFPLSSLILNFTNRIDEPSYYQYNCYTYVDSADATPFGYVNFGNWYSYDLAILAEGDEKNKIFTNELYQETLNRLALNYEEPDIYYWDTVNYTISSQIYSLSKELYLYSKSLNAYSKSKESLWTANSPPQVYTNINGGYGIFASMSYSNTVQNYIFDKD